MLTVRLTGLVLGIVRRSRRVASSSSSKTVGQRRAYCAVMSERLVPSVRPQPMIAVADVVQTSGWYQQVLGATSGHGGAEYEQLLVDGVMILQLHRLDVSHHHDAIGDPEQPLGNGVAVWFEADDFDAAVGRIRDVAAEIVIDVHLEAYRKLSLKK